MIFRLGYIALMLSVSALALSTTTPSPSLGTSTTTTTADLTGATSSPGVISPEYALVGFENCTIPEGMDPQKIKDGFSEMIRMLQGSYGRYPTIDWNSGAAQDFWGPYSRNAQWRSLIKANLDRAAEVSYQYWLNPFAPRLHVRCDDPEELCPCVPGEGVTVAYTIDNQPDINFCPRYFQKLSLDAALRLKDPAKEGDISFWNNRAKDWAHELMHIREIGYPSDSNALPGIKDIPVQGWPGIRYWPTEPWRNKPAYGDWFTKWLAQSAGNIPEDPVNNADNYALFVLANYVLSKKGWYPSRRQVPISPLSERGYATSLNSTGVDTDTVYGDSPFDYNNYCYSHPDS